MFTKRKFQEFTFEKQHKKCAELLKRIYENLAANQSVEDLFEHYHILQVWMNCKYNLNNDFKQVADRYHYHLKLADQRLQEHNLLPVVRKGDKEHSSGSYPIVIYLDGLRSAHNVGSIIRTVEAFGLGTIYFSEQTPYIDNKQVQNTSKGAFQWVQCNRDKKVNELPKPLVVMETSPHASSLYDFVFPEVFTLAVGNEEYGCSDEILSLADCLIEIPLRGRKNSLNVANALAIAAGEIQRQNCKGKI